MLSFKEKTKIYAMCKLRINILFRLEVRSRREMDAQTALPQTVFRSPDPQRIPKNNFAYQ